MTLTDNDSSVGNGLFLAITDLTWMFKYHQKHYDISKYFNATLVQPVKSRAVTSKYQMKSYFHFLPRCEQRAQTGQRAPGKERVCARGQPLGRLDPNPQNWPSKILDLFKKVHKTKEGTRQLCLLIVLRFLSFFCSKMRYSVSQDDETDIVWKHLSRSFLTFLPHFTLPMLENNQCTSTSLRSLH